MSGVKLTDEQLDRLFQRASYWISQRRPPLLDWSKYDVRVRGLPVSGTWGSILPADPNRVYLGFSATLNEIVHVSINAGGNAGGAIVIPSQGTLVEFYRERHGPLPGVQWYGIDSTAIPSAFGVTAVEVIYYPNRR